MQRYSLGGKIVFIWKSESFAVEQIIFTGPKVLISKVSDLKLQINSAKVFREEKALGLLV